MNAEVVEWQTRRTQNPLVAIPCGFKSHLRHQNYKGLIQRCIKPLLYIQRAEFELCPFALQ